ncbi:PIN domain-containing protein [Mobiluncus porci]|uniref:PIN domain-containing protein n=1 Tax=Mobiluncus porci TaxID=2652278 RepID=A0A7K0K2H1_9ACTO|nr:PIN domain-containing protein [Mobiluncus porci]MST49245.1 PIN domain-containing protein [Mobiluncus porci]
MRCLIDTNVLIDLLGGREPFYEDADRLVRHFDKNDFLVSASCVTDIYYILHRNYVTKADAILSVRLLREKIATIVEVTDADIAAALDSPLDDFEDAVLDAVAKRHGVDYLITRNLEDFQGSRTPCLTPADFLVEFGEN